MASELIAEEGPAKASGLIPRKQRLRLLRRVPGDALAGGADLVGAGQQAELPGSQVAQLQQVVGVLVGQVDVPAGVAPLDGDVEAGGGLQVLHAQDQLLETGVPAHPRGLERPPRPSRRRPSAGRGPSAPRGSRCSAGGCPGPRPPAAGGTSSSADLELGLLHPHAGVVALLALLRASPGSFPARSSISSSAARFSAGSRPVDLARAASSSRGMVWRRSLVIGSSRRDRYPSVSKPILCLLKKSCQPPWPARKLSGSGPAAGPASGPHPRGPAAWPSGLPDP